MKVRVGFDTDVTGDIESRPDGTLVFLASVPAHEKSLRDLVQFYAQHLVQDRGSDEGITGEDVLAYLVLRMTSKRNWAQKVEA